MKTQYLKSIVCALPVLVLVVITSGRQTHAQEKKRESYTITIRNGDTTVNGIALSKAEPLEKEKLRKEVADIQKKLKSHRLSDKQVLVFADKDKRQLKAVRKHGKAPNVFKWEMDSSRVFSFNNDNLLLKIDSASALNRFIPDSMARFRGRMIKPHDFNVPVPNAMHVSPRVFVDEDLFTLRRRPNSQNFSYQNTDKDGISTTLNISVSDATPEQVEKATGKEVDNSLTIDDLNFAPHFSSGKISILFTLSSTRPAQLKLLDNEMKPVLSDKVSEGSYTRQVTLPRNGIYYLLVTQDNKYAVKRVVKQQ